MMTEADQSQEADPFAGFSPAMWMAYIHQDGGAEGLTELLDMLSGPTPELIDERAIAESW
jgi:hypothetical protein